MRDSIIRTLVPWLVALVGPWVLARAGVTPADLTAVLTVVVGAVYYVGARLLEQVWPSARFLLGGPPAPSYVGRHAES